jgi:hypothetical protein
MHTREKLISARVSMLAWPTSLYAAALSAAAVPAAFPPFPSFRLSR